MAAMTADWNMMEDLAINTLKQNTRAETLYDWRTCHAKVDSDTIRMTVLLLLITEHIITMLTNAGVLAAAQ